MNGNSAQKIVPVLLSGGTGSRLWPLSRELYPKQFLPLCSDRTMLQDTALRVSAQSSSKGPSSTQPSSGAEAVFSAPLVICNQEHRFLAAEQLRQSRCTPRGIILEPAGRNTAAACALAALAVTAEDPDALLLILPADHEIRDAEAFRRAVAIAARAAQAGRLVTFGITPTRPETGYGYIRRGHSMDEADGAYNVAAFVEKPSLEVAERYLAEGTYAWNSGMFLFPAARLLAELERHAPAVLAACREALDQGSKDLDFFRLDAAAFAKAPSISIDYAVMERTDRAAVVPCEIGWTDVGAWSALWDVGNKDGEGNVVVGDVLLEGARDCYVRSDNHLTAVVGVENAVVVVVDDAVLVADRSQAQDVKRIVDRLKAEGRSESVSHRRVHRPWGSYQSLHTGDRFQVKSLTIAPGSRLSLQKHHHRAEHWVVVNGTALVTRGEEQVMVYENQSIYIPIGTVHRLENPGKVPLTIIEVQSGSYLGEDDIVRLEDVYGRN
ncbi:mannose-1-phosphate guanylyltransferase/mannose-1-phosphate guanylyltransferase/mannose-6-phosphate isomerase [Azospirillum lipoferum]|uniref:mannose-1-phosphate guanylyltransferase n=1 Tax=Azospirillum lipoferum TaxID=193 RepID=A0A5A9GJC1_AZOLI|nr:MULTISPECIES: mannose-1-phosphate guanylyltransferase/mannose-6-phosphate isomerase [Azospirillum]KAA0593802.1 mannose-1-phosphate guanylyltransferase/mannose-6-phosphate isomerase [Azospirillum lipoferum]MCP1614140.1 mannose-1-phosphate guanylyltransferase/mannose-1-phosphate guanylyltransferase/mannose-6-phosphate isomerase [Azospirillum lipoferum]MDW5536826.1 mannose-1-phosphate guanylyltransferase/mannose-6-phosphate isomerase [Azospirillum sp. NL1]